MALIEKHNIDEHRAWNLDETGYTPGRDANRNFKRYRYLRRGGTDNIHLPEFVRSSRTTVLPVVSAADDSGQPLFVFRGKRLPFREVVCNDAREV